MVVPVEGSFPLPGGLLDALSHSPIAPMSANGMVTCNPEAVPT